MSNLKNHINKISLKDGDILFVSHELANKIIDIKFNNPKDVTIIPCDDPHRNVALYSGDYKKALELING